MRLALDDAHMRAWRSTHTTGSADFLGVDDGRQLLLEHVQQDVRSRARAGARNELLEAWTHALTTCQVAKMQKAAEPLLQRRRILVEKKWPRATQHHAEGLKEHPQVAAVEGVDGTLVAVPLSNQRYASTHAQNCLRLDAGNIPTAGNHDGVCNAHEHRQVARDQEQRALAIEHVVVAVVIITTAAAATTTTTTIATATTATATTAGAAPRRSQRTNTQYGSSRSLEHFDELVEDGELRLEICFGDAHDAHARSAARALHLLKHWLQRKGAE